jgi:hypothetical protein
MTGIRAERRKTEVEAVLNECVNLLIVYFFYSEAVEQFDPNGTRVELLRWRIHTRVIENDLILRLCRLDDDDKTTHSLREALRSIRNSLPDVKAKEIDNRLREYRKVVNPLKTKARNYYLAHLSKDSEVPHATDSNESLGDATWVARGTNRFEAVRGELWP